MATSTCPHCHNDSFELGEGNVGGVGHKLFLVQCTGCGAPVAAFDTYAFTLLQEQEARIKHLEQQIATISSSVGHIHRVVAAMANQRTI
jgi:hypothetical protein